MPDGRPEPPWIGEHEEHGFPGLEELLDPKNDDPPEGEESTRERQEIFHIDRTLPNSKVSEECLLSAILHDNTLMTTAEVARLKPEMMFRDAHRRIFVAMRVLWDSGIQVEYGTLVEALSKKGELDECGGEVYLAHLYSMPESDAVQEYAGIIRDGYLLRNLILILNQRIAACYDNELPAVTIYSDTLHEVFGLGRDFLPER